MKLLLPIIFVVCSVPAWAQNPVSVRVLDEGGKPIAGAVIAARVFTREEPEIAPLTTDATGAATFSLPNGDDGKTANTLFTAGATGYGFAHSASIDGKTVEIELSRGQIWRGKVVDDKDKPLEGARISIRGAMKEHDFSSAIFLGEDALGGLYSAQSKADGSFEIPNLPDDKALLYAVTRPMFVRVQGQDAKIGIVEQIKMQPGGALKGHALDVAGKPLAALKVYAKTATGRGGGGWTTTDAKGSFTLDGLASGAYVLGATEPNGAAWVMPRLEGVRVEVGQTATAGDWRAQKAIEIRGFARDKVTKKPLANAHFAAQDSTDRARNDDSAWGISDPNGRFVLRVLPGQYTVTSRGAPSGFLQSDEIKTVEAKAGAVAEITFDLQSAPIVRGITRDENDKPIAAKLLVGGFGRTVTSDAQGKWEYAPSGTDDLTFGGGSDDDGYFEVVTPKRVHWPATGPIAVTVRRHAWQSLAGRVVTPDGTPVEGVKVEASFVVQTSDSGGYGVTVSAVSDAEGRYVLEKLRDSRRRDVMGTEVKVSAQKAGFQFTSGGEVTRAGDKPIVSDLVFAPLSKAIEGTTRAGATVVVAGREARADDAGHFAFEALPEGKNIVYAAQGELFGSAPLSQTPLEIGLQRPTLQGRDDLLAAQLWAQAKREGEGEPTLTLDEWLAQPDFAANLQIARQSGDKGKVAQALQRWKRGDSLQVLRDGLEAMEPSAQRTSSFLEAALTADDAELTARALEVAGAQFETMESNILWREPQLYQAAVLIERRDGAEAGAFALRTALAYTLKNHPVKSRIEGAMQTAVGRNEAFMNAASIAAAGSPAMLREVLDSIETGSGFAVRARAEAIPVVVKTHGFDAAVPLLEELQKMPAPTLDTETRYQSFDVDWAFGQAVHDSIEIIGAGQPEQSLEWARKVEGDEQRARALASAARFGTPAVAAPLLREAVAKIDSEDAPRLAAWAFERDPQLGLELFEVARQKADDEMKSEMNWRNAWIPFAFYYARANPAQSRLILEREWAKSREANADEDVLATIAIAMAPLDAQRATAMADELGAGENGWGRDAKQKIARYLIADDATRRGLILGRIGSREAWDAGTLQW